MPPQGRADYAFFQHIIKSLKPDNGRCAILFPHGVLFRDEEAAMRRRLLEQDVIECVLGLGANLFYNSPMEACVVVCRMKKPKERRGRVLFINAVDEVTREQAQSFLTEAHIKRILAAYRELAETEGFARVVSVEEIGANAGNLSIPLYVRRRRSAGQESSVDGAASLASAVAAWEQSSAELRGSMKEMFKKLVEYGIEVRIKS